MKPEDLLFELKQMSKNNLNGIPMFYFKSMMCRKHRISMKYWSSMIRYLVSNRKIEMFGADQRIRPLMENFEKNLNHEIRIDDNLIKDVLSEISPCTPKEAFNYCQEKYGNCNCESFTRRMREMAVEGKIFRDGKEYSLTERSTQMRLL